MLMKCEACGYQDTDDGSSFNGIFIKGQELTLSNNMSGEITSCCLFSCPKCGTVKMTQDENYIIKAKSQYKMNNTINKVNSELEKLEKNRQNTEDENKEGLDISIVLIVDKTMEDDGTLGNILDSVIDKLKTTREKVEIIYSQHKDVNRIVDNYTTRKRILYKKFVNFGSIEEIKYDNKKMLADALDSRNVVLVIGFVNKEDKQIDYYLTNLRNKKVNVIKIRI